MECIMTDAGQHTSLMKMDSKETSDNGVLEAGVETERHTEESEENGAGDERDATRTAPSEHCNQTLPSSHRFMPIDRLNIFSDAVFAAITTFMVVPLKEEVQNFDVSEDLWSSLAADRYRFLIFVISFFIISTLWQDHVWVLQRVEHVGDVGLILNVLLLLIASLIPFLAALMSDFYRYALISQLFGGCILALSLVQTIMILLAFRRGKMLSDHIAEGKIKKWLVAEFISSACLKIALSTVSIGIAVVSIPTALALLVLIMFTDWICIIAITIYRKFKDTSLDKSVGRHLCHRFVLEDVDMDRTQTFTDGVFIIVATLIILDITAESMVPLDKNSSEEELYEDLLEQKEPLLAYISTFLTIGMIWYINYSMFHFLQRLSRLLLLFNRLTLLFVSVIPVGFQLVSIYAVDNAGRNENKAVQFHCFLIFCASIFQMAFWVAAHWKRDKHFTSNLQGLHRKRIVCLLLVYPITTGIIFCTAFSSTVFKTTIIHAVELSIPLLFFIIKLVFEVLQHHQNCRNANFGHDVSMETIPAHDGNLAAVFKSNDVETRQ